MPTDRLECSVFGQTTASGMAPRAIRKLTAVVHYHYRLPQARNPQALSVLPPNVRPPSFHRQCHRQAVNLPRLQHTIDSRPLAQSLAVLGSPAFSDGKSTLFFMLGAEMPRHKDPRAKGTPPMGGGRAICTVPVASAMPSSRSRTGAEGDEQRPKSPARLIHPPSSSAGTHHGNGLARVGRKRDPTRRTH